MLTCIRYKDFNCWKEKTCRYTKFGSAKKKQRNTNSHHAKVLMAIFLAIFNVIKHKCIPQTIELVPSIVHHTC